MAWWINRWMDPQLAKLVYLKIDSYAESTAPLRIVGELSHLKHSVGPP